MQSVIIKKCTYHSTLDLRTGIEHIFHLVRFDSLTEYHYLIVTSVEECKISVRQFIAEISAAVHACAIGQDNKIFLFRWIT